jgi:hypothetical protein
MNNTGKINANFFQSRGIIFLASDHFLNLLVTLFAKSQTLRLPSGEWACVIPTEEGLKCWYRWLPLQNIHAEHSKNKQEWQVH